MKDNLTALDVLCIAALVVLLVAGIKGALPW